MWQLLLTTKKLLQVIAACAGPSRQLSRQTGAEGARQRHGMAFALFLAGTTAAERNLPE